MRLSKVAFTKNDLKMKFASSITDSSIFKFCPLDVWRCRTEAYVLVMNLARMYSTERVLDASMSIQSKSFVDDSCPVVRVPGLLNCTFLSANIDKGDTIEYRVPDIVVKNRENECIRRATVVGIRLELDKITKTVILNNGDKLSDALHLVRRVSMRNIYTGEPMWNPVREWRELRSIHMYPTEDAADDSSIPLEVCDANDDNDDDGDIVMSDPSKIQSEYERH